MTLEEAQKIAKAIGIAGRNWYACVIEFVNEMQKTFPEFKWTFREATYEGGDDFNAVEVEPIALSTKDRK